MFSGVVLSVELEEEFVGNLFCFFSFGVSQKQNDQIAAVM